MFNITEITQHQFLTLLEDFMQDNLLFGLDLEDMDIFLSETIIFNK